VSPRELRILMHRLHLTSARLAAKLGVSASAVRQWRSDGAAHRPIPPRHLDTLKRLAAEAGVPIGPPIVDTVAIDTRADATGEDTQGFRWYVPDRQRRPARPRVPIDRDPSTMIGCINLLIAGLAGAAGMPGYEPPPPDPNDPVYQWHCRIADRAAQGASPLGAIFGDAIDGVRSLFRPRRPALPAPQRPPALPAPIVTDGLPAGMGFDPATGQIVSLDNRPQPRRGLWRR
jgi:transcriptional regulator with XRE-family HTH domain